MHDSQVAQTEKIEFQYAQLGNGIHIVLGHGGAVVDRQRDEFRHGSVGNDDACGVHRGVARHTLQRAGGIHQLLDGLRAVVESLQVGQGKGVVNGDTQLVRYCAGDRVHVGIAHAHGAAHVPNGGTSGQRTKGDDLGHVIPPVFVGHVRDDLIAAAVTEIHVDIGHAHALGVEESLKEQVKRDGIHLGDAHAVGHKTARARSTAGADGNIAGLGKIHVILHDEEVVGVSHAPDHVQLVGQTVTVSLLAVLAPIKDDLPRRHATGKALLAQMREVRFRRKPVGAGILRQIGLGKVKLHRATLGDLDGVFNGTGVAGEEHLHLPRVLIVKLIGGKAHTASLLDGTPRLDTGQHLLHVGVLAAQIVAVVGGHHGNVALAGEPQESRQNLPLLGQVVVLQLDVVTVRSKDFGHGHSRGARAVVVPCQEAAGHVARQAGGQRDESSVVTAQKLHVHARTTVKSLCKSKGNQGHKVAVSLHVLTEQHQVIVRALARLKSALVKAGGGGNVDLAPDDGLDARLAAGLIEGDSTVENAMVGQRHGVMPAGLDPRGQIGDAAGTVEQAVFTVQMQMDKSAHGVLLSSRFYVRVSFLRGKRSRRGI